MHLDNAESRVPNCRYKSAVEGQNFDHRNGPISWIEYYCCVCSRRHVAKMALNREKEIASLKKVFKKLAHKGPLSSAYMLPVKSIFGSSNCILEIKVPRGYPDKDVEIKMINPIPHLWANNYGVITCPDWLKKLPLVYVVEAVLTQFDGYSSNASAAATAPNQRQQHNIAQPVTQPDAEVASTAHNPIDGADGGSTGANKHDASSVDQQHSAPTTEVNSDANVDERLLKVCRNPPTGVFQTLLCADREEVMSMLANEDTRWKILYSSPQLEPLLSELHQLLQENEAAALAVISTVNKKQERLKSIEQKIKTVENMEVKPADATKLRKKYLTAYHEHNKASIKALKQQIADKVKAMERGEVSFHECYDELSKMHLKCNELSAIQIAMFR
ncbi:transcriptional family protein, putative [Babesia ovata]|uniref:Transcriptional family protein, putative n=1 Tax=Babesia ovata TaxID=189622 RepID=A0A2H6KD03_9APIC|nr:transcriptional family protein, putative [Babesia ovata]GBE60876.1 transcriptional family protein, putative [Babesia ovata]